jgi:peptidyl-prolyl cis-trans isomerase SurA
MKRSPGVLFILIISFLAGLNASGQLADDRALLTVNGKTTTAGEFMRVYNKNNLNRQENNPEAIREYLELYVNFRLKVEEAMELGLDTLTSFRKELGGYRSQLAQPYFSDDSVEAKLLREAYERSQYDIRASHILVRVDRYASAADSLAAYDKIMAVRERILAGENFGMVAAEVSEDPSARDSEPSAQRPARKGNRGDLGYFTVFDMVYPFENAAYNTPPGSVSMPVRTDYGYHLIKVTDKQPALGQVQVAHIYISIPNTATAADSAQKMMKANNAYDKLTRGANFAAVVKEYSEDKGSIASGGKLPWFGANRMVPEFISVVRSLPDTGAYSRPFLTPFGWHIVKLLDRKKVGTFEDEKVTLNGRLEKDQRKARAEEAVIARIKKENKFKEYPKARNAVLSTLDSSILTGEWDANRAAGLIKTVFTIGGKKYTQTDLARYLSINQNKKARGIDVFFNENYARMVRESCIAYEDSQLENKYEDFRLLMQEYHDGILLFDLTDQKVWSRAVKDTTGLNQFHERNKAAYMWDERLDASIVTVLAPEMVDVKELQESFSSGKTVEDILAQYNSDTLTVISIESGRFSKGDHPVTDAIQWIQGPSGLVDSEDGKAFAYVYALLPPQPKTLDEARGLITADYQEYLEKQWVTELRAKYPVTVDDAVLATLK